MAIITKRHNGVVVIKLNRPKVLNAINSEMLNQLLDTMLPLDNDPEIGCFILTGNGKAFAAGADISELAPKTYSDMLGSDYFSLWEQFAAIRTPKIAAVNGYALGGGCELAMMCDLLFAAHNAQFGQPEIKLGVIPGMGGSQRLTKLIGRARAMDLILTGRTIAANEAEKYGLVSRVYPSDTLLEETLSTAQQIAAYSKPAVLLAKETVNQSEEIGLNAGIRFERRNYHALFSTNDQKEGMMAFLEKREAKFIGS